MKPSLVLINGMHQAQCPTCGPGCYEAQPIDTRPRVPYILPDGTRVLVIHDEGELPRPTVRFQLASGVVVVATAEGRGSGRCPTCGASENTPSWRTPKHCPTCNLVTDKADGR